MIRVGERLETLAQSGSIFTNGLGLLYIPEDNLVRKLTIQECYRIMGFPDNFKKANSLAKCYKQIGNSVCIPLIEAIAQELLKQKLFSEDNFYESPRKTQESIQLVLFN